MCVLSFLFPPSAELPSSKTSKTVWLFESMGCSSKGGVAGLLFPITFLITSRPHRLYKYRPYTRHINNKIEVATKIYRNHMFTIAQFSVKTPNSLAMLGAFSFESSREGQKASSYLSFFTSSSLTCITIFGFW